MNISLLLILIKITHFIPPHPIKHTLTNRKRLRKSRSSSNWLEELTSHPLLSRSTRRSTPTVRSSSKPSSRSEERDTNTLWLSTTLVRPRSCNNPCHLLWTSRLCKLPVIIIHKSDEDDCRRRVLWYKISSKIQEIGYWKRPISFKEI